MQTLPKERRYETLSYLPPLSDAQITRQIEYTLKQGFYPAILLDSLEVALVQRQISSRSFD